MNHCQVTLNTHQTLKQRLDGGDVSYKKKNTRIKSTWFCRLDVLSTEIKAYREKIVSQTEVLRLKNSSVGVTHYK